MIPKRKVTGRSARRVVVVSVSRALGSELVLDPIMPGVEKCSPESPGRTVQDGCPVEEDDEDEDWQETMSVPAMEKISS